VRARIAEFLGGSSLEKATCVYIIGTDDSPDVHLDLRSPSVLGVYLDEGLDVARSLWDREALIVHLEIDYVNFDFPGEPYLDPERTLGLQRPVVRAIQEILQRYGIKPLHLLSGCGHHFVWQVQRGSWAFEQLVQCGRVPESLRDLYAKPHPPTYSRVDPFLAKAFAGLGLVLEYVAHCIKETAAPVCTVPVELTAVTVGPGERGREMVSIDISEYGDPLHTRSIRIPFSAYFKPLKQRGRLGDSVADKLPPLFLIPLHEMSDREGFSLMRDMSQVTDLARHVSVQIPDQSQLMGKLVTDYRKSSLARFHDWFYAQEHELPARWAETYDRIPMDLLPPCARTILEWPNDLLLQPVGIKRIVQVMLALGWHPRHIAGLIRSKYERNYSWGELWYRYDASSRADFYTRVFAGLFVVGRDALIDFNCQSAREQQCCFHPVCPDNLERFKHTLMERRKYDRLGDRPFNRLFLSDEPL
jgi:hypothetical protein